MMPTVRSGNVEVFYEVTGAGEPLVLLMGLGADHTVWEPHRLVYEKHFLCIAIDNRGVGRSSKPAQSFGTAEMAADVLAVMDHAGVSRAHVAGISMGGAIAQQLCILAPDRVRSLVLISTWARLPAFHRAVFEHFKSVRSRATPGEFTRCLQLWIWGPAYFEFRGADLDAAQRDSDVNPAPQPDYAFAAQCDACIGHNTLHRLSDIRAPTLITAGRDDIFTPLHLSRELKDAISGAELIEFSSGAHVHHWEELDKFNTETLSFLLRH